MSLESCRSLGFDAAAIAARLDMLGFSEQNATLDGRALQGLVIRPNIESILERFYAGLASIEGFDDIVARHSSLGQIIDTQRRYLLSLGVDFNTQAYFENRLAIGSVHQRIGVSQSQYQCANQRLQFLLIQNIPHKVWQDREAAEAMVRFILKITTLDMSLVVESYCASRTSGLEKSLISERGETERLHHLAVTDWLTDLHNHSNSRQLLSKALRRSRTDSSPLSVFMADLDHFKKINDAHGHLVGDEVLRIAAGRMVSAARSGDQIGRYGGEEFLFILRNTDISEAMDVAERVRGRMNGDAVNARNTELRLTVSLGIAEARDDDDVDTLIDRADAALYSAKLAGRDRVCAEAPARRDRSAARTSSASTD